MAEIMREADKEGLQYASYCKKHGLSKKKELWKVFRKHRKELFAYTVRGEGEDEEEATISLLAYENHCKKSDIYVTLEMR